jgi:DnaK suppressor protein
MAAPGATPRKTTRERRKPAAGTAEVLGNAAAQPTIPRQWQAYYQKLMAAREHLAHERAELLREAKEEEHAVLREDIADAGTDSYDRDFALSIASSEQEALFEIEEALNRIKAGRYGLCEATGKQIPEDRLEAIPWTRFSAEAERELEHHHAAPRVKLGKLADLAPPSRREPDDGEF